MAAPSVPSARPGPDAPAAPGSRIHVLHENDVWVEPLRAAFDAQGLPYAEWFLDRGLLDLRRPPPAGVFYNRMSASSHTRGHRFGPEYAAAVLAWLERHGRPVLNSGRALQLEISKVAQYAALEACGIRTPATVAAVGRAEVVAAARAFEPPFITKHNRAGKGLGVRLFHDREALARYVDSAAFEPAVDGITLIQRYIEAPEPYITRVEFIGGDYFYAVRVDTSQGFELCPADACRVDDAFCPADGEPAADGGTADGGPVAAGPPSLFRIVDGVDPDLVTRYRRFLAGNGIHIAGIEFIVDRAGAAWTYDVNTNTNYNGPAEAEAGRFGMQAIAACLGRELRKHEAREGAAAATV